MKFELPIADPIFQLTFVVLAALLVQIPLERSRIPGLVGLLLVGMLIGPGGLNVLSDEPVVDLLGSVGLLFIMFLAGMEVDLRIVRKHKTEVATIGALGFGIPFATAAAAGLTLGLTWPGAVILGAALSSHTLISYPLIERLGLLHRRPVIATVGGTLFTDTVALTVMIIVLEMQRATAGVGEWLWPLTLLAVLVAVSLIAVPPLARSILGATTPTPAEKALFLLAILLFLASAADLIGTEDILGSKPINFGVEAEQS